MVALFWASTYVLLTIRGAILRDDWSRLIDDNRLLAVSIGAAAYLLVLRKLNEGPRPTLTGVVTWIAGATVAIMLVRVTLDQLLFDDPQDFGVHLLWSLSWSAYFAIWTMGSIAFDTPSRLPPRVPVRSTTAVSRATAPSATAATTDAVARPRYSSESGNFGLLIGAIVHQASDLDALDRQALAERVLHVGGYEMAGDDQWSREQTARARFAAELAAKLTER